MTKLLSEALRPKTFDDLVIPDELKNKFKKMHDTQNLMNMIFHGAPGTGKTSTAKIFIASDKFETIIINGSLETSIDKVRDTIDQFTSALSLRGLPKLVVIDEADFLSKSAQASLRKLIEDRSDNCRFIFTANNIEKVDKALQSRLLPICFDFATSEYKILFPDFKTRLTNKVIKTFGEIDTIELDRIINGNFPDFRTIANKIQHKFY